MKATIVEEYCIVTPAPGDFAGYQFHVCPRSKTHEFIAQNGGEVFETIFASLKDAEAEARSWFGEDENEDY